MSPINDLKCKLCGRITIDYDMPKDGSIVQKCICGCEEFEKMPPRVAVRFRGEGWSKPGHTDTDESE